MKYFFRPENPGIKGENKSAIEPAINKLISFKTFFFKTTYYIWLYLPSSIWKCKNAVNSSFRFSRQKLLRISIYLFSNLFWPSGKYFLKRGIMKYFCFDWSWASLNISKLSSLCVPINCPHSVLLSSLFIRCSFST